MALQVLAAAAGGLPGRGRRRVQARRPARGELRAAPLPLRGYLHAGRGNPRRGGSTRHVPEYQLTSRTVMSDRVSGGVCRTSLFVPVLFSGEMVLQTGVAELVVRPYGAQDVPVMSVV